MYKINILEYTQYVLYNKNIFESIYKCFLKVTVFILKYFLVSTQIHFPNTFKKNIYICIQNFLLEFCTFANNCV